MRPAYFLPTSKGEIMPTDRAIAKAAIEQCKRDIAALQGMLADLEIAAEPKPAPKHGDIVRYGEHGLRVVLYNRMHGGFFAYDQIGCNANSSSVDIKQLYASGDYSVIGNVFDSREK
jgi:hypothetical protein